MTQDTTLSPQTRALPTAEQPVAEGPATAMPETGASALPGNRPLAASLWMLGAIGGFSSMAVAGRLAAPYHDTFEIMTWRSAVGVVIILGVLLLRPDQRRVGLGQLHLHFLRNIAHFTGQNLWFFALTLIPLSQLFALEFSYPLIVALAAPLVLGERLTRNRLLAALLGFVGVLIVAQPWSSGGLSTGTLAALLAAFGFAGSALTTKVITRRVPMIEILFWLVIMQLAFGLIMAGRDGDIALPTAQSVLPLTIIGCAGLGAHFCLTRALSLAPATVVVPMDFLRLPLIAVIGMLLYGEPLLWSVFVGGAIILLANLLNLRKES